MDFILNFFSSSLDERNFENDKREYASFIFYKTNFKSIRTLLERIKKSLTTIKIFKCLRIDINRIN